MNRTLAQKLWDDHVVRVAPGEPDLLYVDLHLVHEVTSPQAFEGLRLSGRRVRRPDLTLATMDHNVPTKGGLRAADELSRRQMDLLAENCRREGIPLYQIGSRRKGIVYVIGPEPGISQGQGHLVEYRGSAIRALSMEGRMTVCNMSIEWGAKAGMVAPDDTTFS